MKVIKRNGKEVAFDQERIAIAIQKAIIDTQEKYPEADICDVEEASYPFKIAKDIESMLEGRESITVEQIQDLVEISLMRIEPKVAKNYILYRDKRNKERASQWEMDGLQADIFHNKYEHNNEGFQNFLDRISDGHEKIRQAMQEKKFLPAGRILAGKGLHKYGIKNSYSNCFVIENPKDNLESIFDTAKKMARTYSYGGGCGTCLGNLRPDGSKVNNAAKETTGAVSFAELFSTTTGLIGQRNRRGALMLTLPVEHPDIESFIKVKANQEKITKANLSIKISNDFMEAVVNDQDFELYFDVEDTGERISKTVKASEIMDMIATVAHDWGEPGFMLWDRIRNYHINDQNSEYEYHATNP